jgi:hypothetical protein
MQVSLRTLSVALASTLVLLGAIGMLICFMFLWSNDMRDIVGAGLGFVAGAFMLGSGCIALAISSASSRADIHRLEA